MHSSQPELGLAASLVEGLPGAPVTTCNDLENAPHEVRLCGTTNVQGRHLNYVVSSCTSGSTNASGRFIHIEQSLSLREDYTAV
ncbi:MAG: hypothetical protein GY822_15660 [Deltaproteobacteria bacterium]|nr:hypothetical protein [Deltaproteobacteria bacterium]